jgi:endonuclease/exonuclease/phosphatase family metal-dependent hydrolase
MALVIGSRVERRAYRGPTRLCSPDHPRSEDLVRRIIALFGITVVAATLATPVERATAGAGPVQLTVMTFNIWYGASQTHGLDEVVEAIERAGADVVGMQEPYTRLRRIANALGFHASPRMHVISRFPILEPSGSDGDWALLLLAPGQVAAIMNTHLSATPYTPYRIVNRGFDRPTILEQERRARMRRITKELERLRPILDAGIPTFFTGDFNSPSYRDWTRPAVQARGLPYPVRWPASLAMEEAGFVDSYRAAHPDPVADPGFTWSPGYPAPFVYPWDVFDRIDFVWAAGPVEVISSSVVGESRANADIVVRPYPTDHRGVASTFELTPAPAPVFAVAEDERARLGNPLNVRFHAPGGAGERVSLLDDAGALVSDRPTGAQDGTVTFDTAGLEQGDYEVVLEDGTGADLARDGVVLVDGDQPPTLTLGDRTLRDDQPLEVTWSYGPGNRYDWLAIFRAGEPTRGGTILHWRYVDGAVSGVSRFGGTTRGEGDWPLEPGRYELRLCLDDSYRCRVEQAFRVVA